MDRRNFIRSAVAGLAGISVTNTPLLAKTGSPLPFGLLTKAKAALKQHSGVITQTDIIGIADFAQHSRLKRFYIANLLTGRAMSYLVAHGKGSDKRHTGWLQSFSNIPGSEATSAGAYVVGEPYFGKHGRSQRLEGLDPENDKAMQRAIVIHGAWYVSPELINRMGKIGRSQGCFAFAENDLDNVLRHLPPGSLLYAARG